MNDINYKEGRPQTVLSFFIVYVVSTTVMKTFLALMLLSFPLSAQQMQQHAPLTFLALGDSYTIGQSVTGSERWPTQLVNSLKKKGFECRKPVLIAATGWRTDDLENAIARSNLSANFDMVSLLIGVNDYFQGRSVAEYKPGFEKLLQRAITLAGGDRRKVFVISIPDYGFTPFGKSNQAIISKGIDVFNDAGKILAQKAGVRYIDITDISRCGLLQADLVAGDGLHPSGKMYGEWVKRILENLTFIDR